MRHLSLSLTSSAAPSAQRIRRPLLRGGGSFFLVAFAMFFGLATAQTETKLPAGYAGSETCATCHEDIAKAFLKNPHQILEKESKRGWTARTCESCHGPGDKHANSASAEDIINPKKLSAIKADQQCLSCHLNQPTQVGRITSGHARSQVSCGGCHQVHATGEQRLQSRYARAEKINKQCSECHTNIWASFQKPHRHRLPERSMSCVSCHNPHGSYLPQMQKTMNANEPGCFRCHADKRGPFIFQHAPVRMEPCSSCHEPHGSANPRMLTRHEVSFQCLECHSNIQSPTPAGLAGGVPPALHDFRNPRIRNCTLCHQKIHGSNVSRGLLR